MIYEEDAYTGLEKNRMPPRISCRMLSSCWTPCVTSLWSCRRSSS